MIRLLASDFDGTIYINEAISEEDRRAIGDFQEEGHVFGIVTGRPYFSLRPLIENKLAPDFIVANNGGEILTRQNKALTKIYKVPMDKDELRNFISEYHSYEINIFTDQDRRVGSISDVDEVEEIISLAIYTEDELDFDPQFDFSYHRSKGVYDITSLEVNKQRGIDLIKEYYSYKDDIIAIGDDFNDISFLKSTPLSFTLDYVKEEEVLGAVNFKVKNISNLIERLKRGDF